MPLLWWIGALMVCVGGYWFWFFIRADVAAEGNSPFRVMRADFFILSLLSSMTLGLIWAWLQTAATRWATVFLGLYLIATTVLFGSVPWSKFSHMFFKPAAAFEKRVSEANGTRSNLPAPADEPETFGSAAHAAAALLISLARSSTRRNEHHADLRLHDALRRLRTLRRYLPVGHHAHRQDLPARLQHRAEHVLGVLLLRQGLPAVRDRLRGYADFAPLGHSVRVLREEEKGTISWKIKFRDGREKNFVSPISTTPWGSIKAPAEYAAPRRKISRSPAARARAGSAQVPGRLARAASGAAQARTGLMRLFGGRKTVFVDADILVVGGGMAGCGATYESRYWGRDLKIVCVEKANIERSGAVAQGLYAINCYMGMQWNENQPEDHVRYARNDLMGLVREDLGYDIARHVDSTVHKFEEWGLPIMRDPKTGRYQREGKWQIMIHGESYKPIVAEAARKAATEVYNRIMVTHLLMDTRQQNRVAGAVGFNVRTGDFYVFRAKAVIVSAGGASHIFKPRSVGEGMGRTWYAPWSSASAYALPILVGAKMTQMENRIVLTRFKDGYGPVGAYFLHLKTYTQNGYGEEYELSAGTRTPRPWWATTSTATRCRPVCATTPSSRKWRPAAVRSAW